MDINKISIRSYTKEDEDVCRFLWRELTEFHREIYNDPSIGGDYPEDIFNEHHGKIGSNRIWIAEEKNEVLGMVGLMGEGVEAEIEPVIVKKGYRRKGIGEKLIDFAIQEAKNLNFKYLNIRPVIRNVDAIRMFHKIGFKNIGRIELFMDLKEEEVRKWKSDLRLFDIQFYY